MRQITKIKIKSRQAQLSIATNSCNRGQTMQMFPPKVGSLTCKNESLVSKETVVPRRWERSKQKFGFIKRVDRG